MMTNLQILEAFETEISKINDIDKPVTRDSLYFLNQAIDKFVKLRFNGDFVHKTSYEQNEKRRSDLIKLFKQIAIPLGTSLTSYQNSDYDVYAVKYPDDFLYSLNEDVMITDLKNENSKNVNVFECTADSFMYRVTNSLTDFHYRYGYARPIRIRTKTGCWLLTDKNYILQQYTLGYLKKPNKIDLNYPYTQYEDFDDSTISEIIKIAAQMYIENIQDKRYNTITHEVDTQE